MKKVALLLMAGFLLSSGTAEAIDFKARGQWLMGFTYGEGRLVNKARNSSSSKKDKINNQDILDATQRIRLYLTAAVSKNLSGTLAFEIGNTAWGHSGTGGALGADAKIVEVKCAYLDWMPSDTRVKVRMGVQGITFPNAAGGSAVMGHDVAGVVASYQFNENIGLTTTWLRPWNDNYVAGDWTTSSQGNDKSNYLDNYDVFMLSLPLRFDGITLTPWVSYGVVGQNTGHSSSAKQFRGQVWEASGYTDGLRVDKDENPSRLGRWFSANFTRPSDAYANAFWLGLPLKITSIEPFQIELDVNYGYIGSLGRGDIEDSDGVNTRFDTKSEGWLVKGVVEYNMDWCKPSIFAWYASGDDDNPSNGSERMPAVSPRSIFSSTFGEDKWSWSTSAPYYDRGESFAGTWGFGFRIRDMSFIEDIKHTFRVIYRAGTNSPSMAKYATAPWSWTSRIDFKSSFDDVALGNTTKYLYLTTQDSLLEFNLINAWKIYENLEVNLELGYILNFIDHETWKKSHGAYQGASFEKQDAWKAQLIFAYIF